jgi:hypothetical protein
MPDFLTREELAKHLRRNSRTFIEIERSKVVGSATKEMASKAK